MNEGGQKTKKILCVTCGIPTNHALHVRHRLEVDAIDDVLGVTPEPGEVGVRAYWISIWCCGGCGEPTVEWEIGPWEETDENFGEYSNFFPPRSQPLWPTERPLEPKVFKSKNLKPELTQLYLEVITCFNNGCLQLCNIGLRTLIEGICRERGCNEGGLQQKINDLKRFVSDENVIEALHAFRVWGNDTAHELKPPPDDLRRNIGFVEDLLSSMYELGYRASEIHKSRSGRSVG